MGAFIASLAPLLLAVASADEQLTGHKVSLVWALGFHTVNDIGFAMLFPVGLALFARAAPPAVGGLMMGVFYLHLFVANMAVGRLGGFLETMRASTFWLLHAGADRRRRRRHAYLCRLFPPFSGTHGRPV